MTDEKGEKMQKELKVFKAILSSHSLKMMQVIFYTSLNGVAALSEAFEHHRYKNGGFCVAMVALRQDFEVICAPSLQEKAVLCSDGG